MNNLNFNISLNSIIFIESLEEHEATSEFIQEFIRGNEHFISDPLNLESHSIRAATEFKSIISTLTDKARNGMRPLLNIDCHGGLDEGLYFLDGSYIDWLELAKVLRPLNEASDFNVMIIFSCCFGAHFMAGMGVIEPAPCAFVLAPTQEIYMYEAMRAQRSFYAHFLESYNLVNAVAQARQGDLSVGAWHAEFALFWYERVVSGYLENYCTNEASRERIANMIEQLKKGGVTRSWKDVEKDLALANQNGIINKYFDIFFMLDKLPANRDKFEDLRICMKQHIAQLQGTGRYIV